MLVLCAFDEPARARRGTGGFYLLPPLRTPALTGAGTLEEIEGVLAKRLQIYRAVADVVIDTAGKRPEEIAAEIAGKLGAGQMDGATKKGGRRAHVR